MKAFGVGSCVVLVLCGAVTASAGADWELQAFAGGGPDGLPALESSLGRPVSVARGDDGTLYVLTDGYRVFRIDPSGRLEMMLDSDRSYPIPYGLGYPVDLALDASGAPLIVDSNRLLLYDRDSDEFTTVDLRPFDLSAIAAGPDGTLYALARPSLADRTSQVYRVEVESGTMERVAGAVCPQPIPPGCFIALTDGTPAMEAVLFGAADLSVAANGDLFVGMTGGVARVEVSSGLVNWFAGNGHQGFGGDGGAARLASLLGPSYLAIGPAGDVWISDSGNHRVRRVDAVTGVIDTVVGDGTGGFAGDGGPALHARLDLPAGLTVGPDGTLWIADTQNLRIRSLEPLTGILSTVAGNGSATFSGDGYPATSASITYTAVAFDAEGNAYIPDIYNHRIRRVDRATGLISTYAGSGTTSSGAEDDGVPALEAALPGPWAVAIDPTGNVFVLCGSGEVRRIDPASGLMHKVPGGGGLQRIALDAQGRLYATVGARRVVRVDLGTGAREIVAGNDTGQYNGEGVPALQAGFARLNAIQFDENGQLYLADEGYGLVRRIDPHTGLVHTVAGGNAAVPVLGQGPFPPETVPALGATIWSSLLAVRGTALLVGPSGYGYTGVARIDTLTGRLQWHWGLGLTLPLDPRPAPDPSVIATAVAMDDAGNTYVGTRSRILLARNTNHSPLAVGGGNRTVRCSSKEGAKVVLNGAASSDPDDVAGAQQQIVEYWWYEDLGLPSQRLIDKGDVVEVELAPGVHGITLQVGDRWAARSTDSFTVDVRDESDPDGDAVGSCADNCPDLSNTDQADRDDNGLGDACDPCLDGPFDDVDGDGICADLDNCPQLPNPGQLDSDADSVGDPCDVCPQTSNPNQTERGTCIVPRRAGECLGIKAEVQGADRRGRVLLSVVDRRSPEAIGFSILHHSCYDDPVVVFYLNDVPLGTWSGEYACEPCHEVEFVVVDSALIASAWRPGTDNEFRFHKSGGGRVSAIRAKVVAGNGDIRDVCLYDPNRGECSGTQCDDGPIEFDVTAAVRHPFFRAPEVLALPFGPAPASSRIDLASVPDGDYRLCVAASDIADPGRLVAASEFGTLFQVDPWTAETVPVGVLPATPLDIAHDPVSGDSMLSVGFGLLQWFDSRDGVPIAPPILAERSYGQIEFGPWGLIGAATYYVQLHPFPLSFWTSLYHVNAAQGSSQYFGVIRNRSVFGLAYDEHADMLRALSGRYLFGGGPNGLVTLDPRTAESSPVASTGHEMRDLVTGPDGLLYSLDAADGVLYRIDADSAEATSVGPTGIALPRALMRTGRQGSVDCIEFPKQGESFLALNSSCGMPSAEARSSTITAECTSEEGGEFVLDGSESTDPNSTAGTNDGLSAFDWFLDYRLPGQAPLGSGETVSVVLPLGVHRVTLRVTNVYGERATDEIQVEVVDTVPPAIEVALTPNRLWPPNHRMVGITADVTAIDACGNPVVSLLSIDSNEPDDAPGAGDGHTEGDILQAERGTSDRYFELRAERSGSGVGRAYSVTYSATDRAGHVSVGESRVVVPTNAAREYRVAPR